MSQKLSDILKPKNVDDILNDIGNQNSLLKRLSQLMEGYNLDDYKMLKGIVSSELCDPRWSENFIFERACKHNLFEIVEIIIKDPRLDPTIHNNRALRLAYNADSFKAIKVLIKDKRITQKLLPGQLELLEHITQKYFDNF